MCRARASLLEPRSPNRQGNREGQRSEQLQGDEWLRQKRHSAGPHKQHYTHCERVRQRTLRAHGGGNRSSPDVARSRYSNPDCNIQIGRTLADPRSALPGLLRPTMRSMVDGIRLLEVRISELEKQLTELAKQSTACAELMSIPGVGLITATAMVAATSGEVSHFKDARHFASWFGLAPKEYSSGQTRQLGRISKRGDRYLRTLLIHGARAVIAHAQRAVQNGRNVDSLRRWALGVRQRRNQNKATCALANKLARICYAVLRDHEPYAVAPRLPYKLERTSFVVAH